MANRKLMTSAAQMMEQQVMNHELSIGAWNLPKCYGAAKNYFTNAKKADPTIATPTYPLIFAKSLSCLKPHGKPFPVPWWAPQDDCVVHEVELGVIMNGLSAS